MPETVTPEETSNEGIYVVVKGSCSIVNDEDGYEPGLLKGGEMFGESDLLKIVGYDFFGRVIAAEDCECMFI